MSLIVQTFTDTTRYINFLPVKKDGKMVIFQDKKRRVHTNEHGIEFFKVKGVPTYATETRTSTPSVCVSCPWTYLLAKATISDYFDFQKRRSRFVGCNKKYEEATNIKNCFSRCWKVVNGEEKYDVQLLKPLRNVEQKQPLHNFHLPKRQQTREPHTQKHRETQATPSVCFDSRPSPPLCSPIKQEKPNRQNMFEPEPVPEPESDSDSEPEQMPDPEPEQSRRIFSVGEIYYHTLFGDKTQFDSFIVFKRTKCFVHFHSKKGTVFRRKINYNHYTGPLNGEYVQLYDHGRGKMYAQTAPPHQEAKFTPPPKAKYAYESDHDILQISRHATPTQIKRAFFKLALIHHPDKGGNVQVFQKISNAYEKLTK